MTIKPENYPAFKEARKQVQDTIPKILRSEIEIDAEINLQTSAQSSSFRILEIV
jgi:hypothetical protein